LKPIERIRAVIHFQKKDRPPVIPELIGVTATMAGISPREYVRSGKVLAECQIDAQRKIGHDAVFAMADLCVEAEAVGCELSYPEHNYPHINKTVIREFKDLAPLAVPDPRRDGRMPEILKAVRLMKASLGEKGIPVMAQATGPITLASRIMDIEKMLYMIVDNPERFREILDFCTRVAETYIDSLITAGADGILVFDPSASPSVLPKRIFREFELPLLRKLLASARKKNPSLITWYSVAGPAQTNFLILSSVTANVTTVDYMVPIETAMKYSGSTVINGNIKSVLFLEGKQDDIIREASSLLAITRPYERFILGSGCEIPLNSKSENIAALVSAVEREMEYFERINTASEGSVEIKIMPYRRKIHVPAGSCLLDAINQSGTAITSYCHRNGSCGKCIVRLGNGALPPPEKIETLQLENHGGHPDDRLACHVRVEKPLEIYIPYLSRILKHQVSVSEELYKKSIHPELEKRGLSPSISHERVDISELGYSAQSREERIAERFASWKPGITAKHRLLQLMADGHDSAWAIMSRSRREIIDFSQKDKIYGLATDIGTTTISAYLTDLETGELKCVGISENSQSRWGLDVMSRAASTIRNPFLLPEMQTRLIEDINGIIAGFHRDYSIPNEQIYDMTVVANPLITHFFLGLDTESLVRSPFIPAVSDWVSTTAEGLECRPRLSVNRNCRIEILPSIGGFVGSDIVGGILASDIHRNEELSVFIDVGTNGEIVIGNRERLVATSMAAGPAFEGAHLSHSHAYRNGIIHRLGIEPDGKIHYETLGGSPPVGLCGSSVLDSMAGFVRNGIISERGYFTNRKKWPQIKKDFFILVPKQQTATFNPIGISAKDIEEVQKAKSAIRTGTDLLLQELGISPDEIKKVFISGSFGICIDIPNAKAIGMIPDFPSAEFHFIRNSAGIGSRIALLSEEARREARRIPAMIRHLNLANHPQFHNCFIDNMLFPTQP